MAATIAVVAMTPTTTNKVKRRAFPRDLAGL